MLTCINFEGGKDKNGYGWQRGYGERKAHRVAYVKANGPVPEGLWVLHKCNNPSCINPEHLYAGTPKQNGEDRVAAGNSRNPTNTDVRGEKNPNAKLTQKDVEYIRSVYKWGMGPELGRQFGIHPIMINRIVRGEAWKC